MNRSRRTAHDVWRGIAGVGALACTGSLVLLAGCQTTGDGATAAAEVRAAPGVPPPSYDEVAAAYNARVAVFERVWARVTAVYRGVDDAGNRLREQAEGHIQIERPDRVALSLGKLGETYLYLGSNGSRYWWIDLVDSDRKVALIGTHAEATPERVRALGLPVRPPELVETIGILRLPETGGTVEPDTRPGAPAGGYVVTAPGRRGPVRLWFAPDGAPDEAGVAAGAGVEPTRIALLDGAGEERLAATLEAYQRFEGVDEPRAHRLPRRVRVESDRFEGWARITMYDPQRRSINQLVFDPEGLFGRLGVNEVIDLDERFERAAAEVGVRMDGADR